MLNIQIHLIFFISVGSYDIALSATGFHIPDFKINTALNSEVFSFTVYVNLTELETSNVAGFIFIRDGESIFQFLDEDGTPGTTDSVIVMESDPSPTIERSVFYVQQLSETDEFNILIDIVLNPIGSSFTIDQTFAAYITVTPGMCDYCMTSNC